MTGSKWTRLTMVSVMIILITGINYYSTSSKRNEDSQTQVEWIKSTPESENMDPSFLNEMMEVISEERLPVDSVIIVRNGLLIKEEYPNSFNPNTECKLWSATKSITSALVGIAIQEGYIKGVDRKIMDYFSEKTVTEQDRKQEITIKHLLTMTAGYQWTNGDGGAMRANSDPIQYVLDKPMVQSPGTVYNYGDGAPFLLGAILSEATGMSTLEFATEYLFEPLNISDVYWEHNRDNYFTASGLHLRPRDMAKIGYIFLNKGKWGEKQIISQSWIEESTQSHVSGSGFMAGDDFYVDGYGYLWWVIPESGVYYAAGMYEQRIYICPELDLIAVFTSHNDGVDVTPRLLFKYILPSCEEYTPTKYSKHGISFSYPRGMRLFEGPSPFEGETVSEKAGFVQLSYDHPYESISVIWYPITLETALDAEINRLFKIIESETTIIEKGPFNFKEVNEREIVYLSANVTENGYKTSGIIACWISDKSERVFMSYYIADPSFLAQEEIRSNFFDHIYIIQEH